MTTVQVPPEAPKKRAQAVGANWWYDQFRQYNHAYVANNSKPDARDLPVWEYPTQPADPPTPKKPTRRQR